MRISQRERQVIVDEVKRIDPLAEIWLFGSRVDDELKGGDIDLLLVSSVMTFSEKIDLLVNIKMNIGDQKIDVHVVTPAQKSTDPLALSVLPTARRL